MSYYEDPVFDWSNRRPKKKKKENPTTQSPSPDSSKSKLIPTQTDLHLLSSQKLSPSSMNSIRIPRPTFNSNNDIKLESLKSSELTMSSNQDLTINNNTISSLINTLDQKYASAFVDNDFPIVIDSLLNAAADLTLHQCNCAQNKLKDIFQVTENIEMKSIQLDNSSDEIIKQAKSAMEDIEIIKKGINEVVNPNVSMIVKIVSLMLYIITTLFHVIQNSFGMPEVDAESESSDEYDEE